jgi:hypothetical protein
MQAFQFYVHDDRFPAPTLLVVQTSSSARAREIALTQMRDCPHRHGVEVFSGGERLFGLGRRGEATEAAVRGRAA